jgi:transcriptional regulator with XRE-family HTH domain
MAPHNRSLSSMSTVTTGMNDNARRPLKRATMSEKHVRARRADKRDAEVGLRVRSRRLENRLSQTELADRIGVTFQQVQKYEKGVNRIGAGRLQRISEALEVPITFFFGNQSLSSQPNELKEISGDKSVFGLLQTSGSVRILKALHRIKSRKAKQLLVELAEELADAE